MSRMSTDALESIPLRLIIIAIVASMSILPAAEALDGLETREFLRRAEIQLDRIVTTAQILSVQGFGNVRTIRLDFSSGSDLGLDELRVGDKPGGSNVSSAVLVLNNGGLLAKTATNPPCQISSRGMTALVCRMTTLDLRMTATMENGTSVIVVEMS